MGRFRSFALTLFIIVFCESCSTVDQYETRVTDANLNSQNALNNEILLNIVRASRFQSTNFMAISQVSGGQTETLTTGFPSIFVGPHTGNNPLTNTLASGVSGGYQSNPLISTAFQNGMLSPISPRTVALLINSRPREIVFAAVLDGIKLTLPDKKQAYLTNDPLNDASNAGRDCSQVWTFPKEGPLYPGGECSYSKFHNLLQGMIVNGLSAELTEAALGSTTTAGASASGSSTSATGLSGRICFDPALGGSKINTQIGKEFKQLCGETQSLSGKSKETGFTKTISLKETKDGVERTSTTAITGTPAQSLPRTPKGIFYPGVGEVQIELHLRSPAGLLNYLGRWLAVEPKEFSYYTGEAKFVLGTERYLSVAQNAIELCYAYVNYGGTSYCVPAKSLHTPMLMGIVEDLRNLNIQPSDLNSAFTVRIAN